MQTQGPVVSSKLRNKAISTPSDVDPAPAPIPAPVNLETKISPVASIPVAKDLEKKESATTSIPAAAPKVFTKEEKVATYTVDGVEKKYSYVDDRYGDAVLRCLVADYCDGIRGDIAKLNDQEAKKVQAEKRPPVTVRVFKIPGDLGFETKSTSAYQNLHLVEFMKDVRDDKKVDEAVRLQKVKKDAETLADYFVKSNRARLEFGKIPGFNDKIRKLIETNKTQFSKVYQERIANFEKQIEHSYRYLDGKNIKRMDLGWDVELQHNFYFLLNKSGNDIVSFLTQALCKDLDLQGKMKQILIADTIPISEKAPVSNVRRKIINGLKCAELKNFLVAHDYWAFTFGQTSTNWTQCNLSVVPSILYDANHMRLFDSDQEFTRGDVRVDVSNRLHRNITSHLFTKGDGDNMGERDFYAMQHLDDLFHGHSVPSLLQESKKMTKFPVTAGGIPDPLLTATFRVQNSEATGQSKALGDFDPIPVVRLLADDEAMRNMVIAFVEAKLQQEGVLGNKEREDFYINRAIELLAENYRTFLAEVTWKQYLQKHYDNTIIYNSSLAHYKGQAVSRTELELIKDMSGATVPQLIFVLDRSGSMNAEVVCASEKIAQIDVVLKGILAVMGNFAELTIKVEFIIVWFDHRAGLMKNGKVYCSTNPDDVIALETDLVNERNSGCLKPDGLTSLALGVETALSVVTKGRKTQIFVFTDGIANDHGLAQYPNVVMKMFEKHIFSRGVKITDLSMVAFHVVFELFNASRAFLDAVIEPCVAGNPSAQSVSLPIRIDLIPDAVGSLCSIIIGNVYKIMGRVENNEPLLLGMLPTNKPVDIYSAVSLADAAAGCTTYLDIADGTTIKVQIPPGTVPREMSLEEITAFEIRELLFEIEERHPGILFSTESKVTKENRELFALIVQEYAEKLPYGAKHIAEYYILGATPSTKAMVQCGLIEVRAAIVSTKTAGGVKPRYRNRVAKPNAKAGNDDGEPIDDGADDAPDEESLSQYAAKLGQTSAQYICKEEKKSVVAQPSEPIVKLPAELVIKNGNLEEKKPSIPDGKLVLAKDAKEGSAEFEANKILAAYAPVQDKLLVMATERRDAAAAIVTKLREVRDGGLHLKAQMQTRLAAELKMKTAACEAEVEKLLAPYQLELADKIKQFDDEFNQQKTPIETEIEQKRKAFSSELKAITRSYEEKIAQKTKEITENKTVATLKQQRAVKETERATVLGKRSVAVEKAFQKRTAKIKADSKYVSKVEITNALIKLLKEYPKQFAAGRNRQPSYMAYSEEQWVAYFFANNEQIKTDIIDIRSGFTSISNTPKSVIVEYDRLTNLIRDAYNKEKTYVEDDSELSKLSAERANVNGEYDATHITPLTDEIEAIETRQKTELETLKNEATDPQKKFETEEIAPLQAKIAAIKDQLHTDKVKPQEKRIAEVRAIKQKAHVKPIECAIEALNGCSAADQQGFDKYFNDNVLPSYEAALVKEENAIDQCNRDMDEITRKLTKAAVKGVLHDREIYRIDRRAKTFDQFARVEMSYDPGLQQQQKTFINTCGIKQISAERNMLLALPSAEDLEAERQEMRFIHDYKDSTPALRIMENDEVAVIRVIREGRIEAETWVTDAAERKALSENASTNVIALLLKNHKRGMKAQIEAIIADKKLEKIPDKVVTTVASNNVINSSLIASVATIVPAAVTTAAAVTVSDLSKAAPSPSIAADAVKSSAVNTTATTSEPLATIESVPRIATMWKHQEAVSLAASVAVAGRPRYKSQTFALRR